MASCLYQVPVLLRRYPEVSVTPAAQVAELLDLGMCVLHIVFDRQSTRVVYAYVASKTPEDAGDLEGE